jgi:hypothetical protein
VDTIANSVELTDFLRKSIKRELLKGKFVSEFDALYTDSAKLALDCYNTYFLNEGKGTLAEIKHMPDGWLPEMDAIAVKVKGNTQKLHFNGYSRFLPWKVKEDGAEDYSIKEEKRRFRQMDIYKTPQLNLKDHTALENRYHDLAKRGVDLKKQRESLEAEIQTVLLGATTTGKLCTIWPEIEPIIKKLTKTQAVSKNLPVKLLNDLNQKLGLKKAA